MQLQWSETATDCNKVREDIARLIHLHLGKHDFFRHFTVKKTSLPLPSERLSYLYIFSGLLIWVQYVNWVCGKRCVFASQFLVNRGKVRGSETFRCVRKKLNPLENDTPVLN